MAILVLGLANSQTTQLPDALKFLSDITGLVIKDEAAFADSFSQEEAADLISLATLLNQDNDFTMVCLAIRERIKGGIKPKEAFLQFCRDFKARNEQEFATVLASVRKRLSAVVTA